jgi:hypothetical protein
VRSFHAIPAIIAPPRVSLLDIDLFPEVLADVRDVEIAVRRVERESPGVTKPKVPDLSARPGLPNEWIVGRNRVRGAGIDIDAKDLSQQRAPILAVSLRISRASTVAQADVEIAVRPERELSAVVVGVGLVHEEDFALRARSAIGVGRDEVLGHAGVSRPVGVIDVELAVRRVLRMERESQKPLLAPTAHDAR